jgi:Protein of unknown function (DUF3047)
VRLLCGAVMWSWAACAWASEIAPFDVEGPPPAPWRQEALPQQKIPFTRFNVVRLEQRTVLQVKADRSYGNLVHPLPADSVARTLAWRWRVDQAVIRSDSTLHDKAGDDAALKVCALFDLPSSAVPLAERLMLRIAESRTKTKLPRATLCYLFDNSLPPGSLIVNPYTARVRSIVLGGALQRWHDEKRDLAADFLRAFGDESRTVPPLRALLIGADSDNTGSSTWGFVDAVRWMN